MKIFSMSESLRSETAAVSKPGKLEGPAAGRRDVAGPASSGAEKPMIVALVPAA